MLTNSEISKKVRSTLQKTGRFSNPEELNRATEDYSAKAKALGAYQAKTGQGGSLDDFCKSLSGAVRDKSQGYKFEKKINEARRAGFNYKPGHQGWYNDSAKRALSGQIKPDTTQSNRLNPQRPKPTGIVGSFLKSFLG